MQCPAQAAFDGPERSQAEGHQRASVGLSWARGKGSRAQALFGHEPSRAWARLVQSLEDTQNLQIFPAYKTASLKLNIDNVGIICSHKTEFLRSQLQKITQHRERTTKLRQKSRCLLKLVQPSHYILLPNFGWLRGLGGVNTYFGSRSCSSLCFRFTLLTVIINVQREKFLCKCPSAKNC